jgi:ACS family glucarate transporter-like MFS transporter
MIRRPRPANIVIVILGLMYFITYLDRVNVSTAAAGFGSEFDLNKTQIGLVFSAFAYPYLVFQIVGGWISDRFGARRTLIACGLLWAGATAITGLATGLASLLIARGLLGFGEGATFPAATTAMSRWVLKEQRGFAQGITHAAARVGNAAAPGVIVAVMSGYGWRSSFFVCAIISFLWVALWAVTFVEFPLHSQNLDLHRSALFASSVFFAGVLGDSLGGIATDWLLKYSKRLEIARSYLVCLCMFLSMLSLIPLMRTHSLWLSLACLSAGFFFSEMTIGAMWAIPMDVALEHSGTASGIMNTGSALAAILSPVVSGYLIDISGNWQLPFVGSMILMGVGMMLSLRMHPERKFVARLAAV